MTYYLQRAYFELKHALRLTSQLEELIRLPIVNQKLFVQCFTHGGDPTKSYDRLEFLGDAVLEALVSDYLYNEFPTLPEGELTQMRSRLVRREALNVLGFKIGLGQYIRSSFLEFDELTEENRRIFGDTLEALIGAIYLNSGYRGAKYFVSNELIDPFVNQEYLINQKSNYKGYLQQLAQKHHFKVHYKTLKKDGNKVVVALEVNDEEVSQVHAKTKKKAEQILAKRFVLNSERTFNTISSLEEE